MGHRSPLRWLIANNKPDALGYVAIDPARWQAMEREMLNRPYPYWTAAPNPDYPGKGQRAWVVMVHRTHNESMALTQQYNFHHTAARAAGKAQINYDQRQRRRVYLGD